MAWSPGWWLVATCSIESNGRGVNYNSRHMVEPGQEGFQAPPCACGSLCFCPAAGQCCCQSVLQHWVAATKFNWIFNWMLPCCCSSMDGMHHEPLPHTPRVSYGRSRNQTPRSMGLAQSKTTRTASCTQRQACRHPPSHRPTPDAYTAVYHTMPHVPLLFYSCACTSCICTCLYLYCRS